MNPMQVNLEEVILDDPEEIQISDGDDYDDDDDVVVLPQEEEDDDDDDDQPVIEIDNVIPSSSSPAKSYTLLETRLHHSTNLTDSPLNSVTFTDCHAIAEFYENCKNKREYPLSGLGSSITLCPTRISTNLDAASVTKSHANVTKFWFLSLRLVTKYGHHITSLEVRITNGVEFPTMFWTVLNKLLRFTPNLRSLFIEASFKAFGLPVGSGGNMLLPQLNSIDEIKCPGLTKLACLGVRFVETNVLTKLMTSKLLEGYGGQLRKLSVTHVTFDMVDNGYLEKMGSLREINLFWWRSNDGQGQGQGQGGSQGLQGVRTSVLGKLEEIRAPGLEKLRVMLNNTGFGTVRHPMYLFKLLGRFPRLKVLNLSGVQFDMDRPGEKGEGVEEEGVMEGNGVLECLKFRDRRDVSYDWLGRLEGLEALFVEGAEQYWLMEGKEGDDKNGEVDERVIKLQGYLYGKQVFKSNIWEKMPRLKMIGVQCQVAPPVRGEEEGMEGEGGNGGGGVQETEEVYTREGYEMEDGEEECYF